MFPARDDSHRQAPHWSAPKCDYIHDLMLVAEHYETRHRESASLVAKHVPELQRLRTILYDPWKAASNIARLRTGVWLTPWEWDTLWPWIGGSFWQWKDTVVPEGDRRVRHLAFGCPAALAARSHEHLKKRLSRLVQTNTNEAEWLRRLGDLLPKASSVRCNAAIYVVEHFSSKTHSDRTLLKVEIRFSDPTNEQHKTTSHSCSWPMLDTLVWGTSLPTFLQSVPRTDEPRDGEWHESHADFRATGNLALVQSTVHPEAQPPASPDSSPAVPCGCSVSPPTSQPFTHIEGSISATGVTCHVTLTETARVMLADGRLYPFVIDIPRESVAPMAPTKAGSKKDGKARETPSVLHFFRPIGDSAITAPVPLTGLGTPAAPDIPAKTTTTGGDASSQSVAMQPSRDQPIVQDLADICPPIQSGSVEHGLIAPSMTTMCCALPSIGTTQPSIDSCRPLVTTRTRVTAIGDEEHDRIGLDILGDTENTLLSSPPLPSGVAKRCYAGTQHGLTSSSHFDDQSDYGEYLTSDPVTALQSLKHLQTSTPSTSPATLQPEASRTTSRHAGEDNVPLASEPTSGPSKRPASLHVTSVDRCAGRATAIPMQTLGFDASTASTTMDFVRQHNPSLRTAASPAVSRVTSPSVDNLPRSRDNSGRFQSAGPGRAQFSQPRRNLPSEVGDSEPSSPPPLGCATRRVVTEISIPPSSGNVPHELAAGRSPTPSAPSQEVRRTHTVAHITAGTKSSSVTPATRKRSTSVMKPAHTSSFPGDRKRKMPLETTEPNTLPTDQGVRKNPRRSS